jgi:UDP-glucose 4-epimerase
VRTLVTGGAGFIGSTLVDRLIEDGHTVAVIDNLATGSLRNLDAARGTAADRLQFHEADIRDPGVMELIAHLAPEIVFHLAAQADVRVSVSDPAFDTAVNVLGSVHVIEGARQAGAAKVVFASSGGTIYGDPDPSHLPLGEHEPRRPLSPYGVAKAAVADYLAAYEGLHGLRWTALALANVYGPRQDAFGEAGVVAIFAGHLLKGEVCTIYGDGDQTRDFVYVGDVVDAFMLAMNAADNVLINIGTGMETSVNRLYEAMAAMMDEAPAPVHAPARAGELQRSCLDPSLARSLGWESRTTLSAGISAVLEWLRTS